MKIGFDNEKYLKMQSEHIRDRINQFDNKLYLEFGGKLFDDFHASRVLPGFAPDAKLRMLMQLSDQAEIVMAISAADIEKNKIRGDLGITYDSDVLRLIDEFRGRGLYVGSVVITQYSGQHSADAFKKRLQKLGIPVYIHYTIPGYPHNVPLIVSDEGYGKNEYIETTRPLVVVTAPGPGSGKMATCLSQLYHEHKRGVNAGYAKYETFPIWNLPLKHPVNLAYEAATADLNDVNMIDPFHLEAYGVTTVNYNRDVEIFPVLRAIFQQIFGESPYKSPTDMGVNMAGNCIIDDEACREASRQEIIRRYYTAVDGIADGSRSETEAYKIELLMKQEISTEIKQELVKQALAARKFAYVPYSKFRVGAAVLAKNGTIYTGCNIENAAYTPTNCAERTAVFKAVSEGITEFDAIAVCGGPGEAEPEDFCTPCGDCRQGLREFVDPNVFLVLLCKGDGSWKEMTLEELLPMGFGKENL